MGACVSRGSDSHIRRALTHRVECELTEAEEEDEEAYGGVEAVEAEVAGVRVRVAALEGENRLGHRDMQQRHEAAARQCDHVQRRALAVRYEQQPRGGLQQRLVEEAALAARESQREAVHAARRGRGLCGVRPQP